MFSLMINSIMILLFSMIIMLIALLLSKKLFIDREKSSPFECGFEPFSSSRLPFSLHFFLIAIIFLIFDVEITLIMPTVITLKYSNLIIWMYTNYFFIIILLIGLFYEWNKGALSWMN